MNKKNAFLVFCLASMSVGAVIFAGQTQSKSNRIQPDATARQQVEELPEHVPYMFLFHHLRFLKERAEEIERQGRGKSALLSRFQEEAALNEKQFQILQEVAFDCELEVAELDKTAEVIIEGYRKRYPPGAVMRGNEPPPPPAELISLQQERNATILRARDRVREALGEREFARLQAFVKMRITPNVKSMRP